MKKSLRILMVGALSLTLMLNPLASFAANNSGGSSQTPPQAPPGGGASGSGGMGGADTMTYDYSGTLSASYAARGKEKVLDEKDISTSKVNKNVILACEEGTMTLKNSTLNKSGDNENGDECNFYGLNSISLTSGKGSKTYLSDSTLKSDSTGSNGIFASDNGKAYARNVTIETTKDNSRGIDATYGGTVIADKVTISTKGAHCAALATDRGGGNVSVTNSSLSTSGSGSPLLYSTGDIEVDNVKGTATGSQIAGMEGLNTILIKNSTLKSTLTKKSASDPVADGVIIYQSTSGDAESSTGEKALFQAEDSVLSSSIQSGAMFYVTNTNANVVLSNTKLKFDTSKASLLLVAGNDSNNWGTAGQNGGKVNFTAIGETLKGKIKVDSISTARIKLLNGTTYTGKTSIIQNNDGSAKSNNITMSISSDSTWIVTGDSTLSNLNVATGAKITDTNGKAVSIIVNGKTEVKGDSEYSITVTSSYTDNATVKSSNSISTDTISRTAFDKYFGTSTTFGTNKTAEAETKSEKQEQSLLKRILAFFHLI